MKQDWKVCTVCHSKKRVDDFYWHSATQSYCSECKECTKARAKKYRLNHLEQIKETRQKYKGRRKEIRYETDRRHYLKHKYGLTEQDYQIKYTQQKGCCEICGKFVEYHKLCIDHDHTTGQIRGLLCPQCNYGLGHFQDNMDTLQSAIDYLRRYNNNGTS